MTLNSLGRLQTPMDILILTARVQDQSKKDDVWQGFVKSLQAFIRSQNNRMQSTLRSELDNVNTKIDRIQDDIKELKQIMKAQALSDQRIHKLLEKSAPTKRKVDI